jgi:hypothetical protein
MSQPREPVEHGEQPPVVPVPFNTTDPFAMKWTDRAFDLLKNGKMSAHIVTVEGIKAARIDGSCPYCDDQIHLTEPLTAITQGSDGFLGRGIASRDEAELTGSVRFQDVTITCGCNEPHAGDPNKSTGCGTSFRISVSETP